MEAGAHSPLLRRSGNLLAGTKRPVAIENFAVVHASNEYIFFRARHAVYGAVVLKCCHQNASVATIAKLRWEYYITRELNIPGLVVPCEVLYEFESSPLGLILPDYPIAVGEGTKSDVSATSSSSESPDLDMHRLQRMTLGDHIRVYGKLSIENMLTLLEALLPLLKALHQRDIMYRNFSLSNVLLEFAPHNNTPAVCDWTTLVVRLCDFSHSSKVLGELVSPSAVELVVSSDPRFMSPESTGRINRNLDLRSDFYSLGMVMHGAVTGNAPSSKTSLLNLIHYHVAVVPQSLVQYYEHDEALRNDPRLWSQVVNVQRFLSKMIAKLPEDRYRTCDDILADLDRLRAQSTSPEPVDFTPFVSARPEDVLSNNQLYGRSAEVASIQDFQRKVRNLSVGGVLVVAGPSGVGKTSLVQELVQPAFNNGGIYCSGKYDQYKRDMPFMAFIQACSDLVSLLLLEDAERLRALVAKIKQELAENTSIVVELIPSFRHLLEQDDSSVSTPSARPRSSSRSSSVTSLLQETEEQLPSHEGILDAIQPLTSLSATLSPSEVLVRMQKSLTTFLEVVSAYKPLTIFIDDVQWADWSSARYILRLIGENMPKRVLLVLAYRSDEIAGNQYLANLQNVLQTHATTGNIMLCEQLLRNMTPETIAGMLSDMFSDESLHDDPSNDLVALVSEKTGGNPFYVRRFLQILLETGAIKPRGRSTEWAWDVEQIRLTMPTDNVVEMLVARMQSLPPSTRLVLMIASLLGNQFTLDKLGRLLQAPELAVWNDLMPAVNAGYVRLASGGNCSPAGLETVNITQFKDMRAFTAHAASLSERGLEVLDGFDLVLHGIRYWLDDSRSGAGSTKPVPTRLATERWPPMAIWPETRTPAAARILYQWEHDRVQQSAYQIGADQDIRDMAHYTIGCWLLRTMRIADLDEQVFGVPRRLIIGKSLITDQRDRLNFVRLLLVAQSKARSCSAFETAAQHSRAAIEQLPSTAWQTDYELAFNMYLAAIVTEFENENLQQMKHYIDYVQSHDLRPQHKTKVYEQEVSYFMAQSLVNDGVQCGLRALDLLGYHISSAPQDIERLEKAVAMDIEDIASLQNNPLLTDPVPYAAVRMLVTLQAPTYFHDPALLKPLILTNVSLSLANGNSDYGAFGYCLYGLLLNGTTDDIQRAYEFGKLGLRTLSLLPPTPLKCHAYKVFSSHIQPWVDPLPRVFENFEVCIQAGKTWQQHEYAGYGVAELLYYKFISGMQLKAVADDYKTLSAAVDHPNAPIVTAYRDVTKALVDHLRHHRFTNPADYLGEELQRIVDNSEADLLRYCYWWGRTILHFLADEGGKAQYASEQVDKLSNAHPGTLFVSEFLLYKGLIMVRRMMTRAEGDAPAELPALHDIIQRFEFWAKHCPTTFECRLALLRGCYAWLCNDQVAGLDYLDAAVELAQQHGFQNIEAIAYEMAGRFWSLGKKRHLATLYMSSAYRAYKLWGAQWKAQFIRHYEDSGRMDDDERSTQSDVQLSDKAGGLAATTASESIDDADVQTIVRWTVALASEKSSDSLLEQFIRLALLYTGGREGHMFCFSTVDDNQHLHTELRPTNRQLPMVHIANYVIRTKEVITDASPVVNTFVRTGQISVPSGSFLFYPIVQQGMCIGVLYLANELSGKVFANSKRQSLLQLLSSQLTISFENMRLLDELRTYNQTLQEQTVSLEEMVSRRTSELERINRKLSKEVVERKKAEKQAMQAASANRSFLHNMSHELRTPLNCIIGMAELLSQTTLTSDQTDILEPVLISARDLLQIINDILDLSKIESGKLALSPHEFSLRDTVDNSLESIAALARKKAITLVALYPASVPSALFSDGIRIGQVLRNLLSNAIKFTKEGEIRLEVEAQPVENAYAFTIRCVDTGIGIPAEQMDCLFKPFSQVDPSTTRKFGGTGLGLNISRGFARLLSGDLVCGSENGKGSVFTFTFRSELNKNAPAEDLSVIRDMDFVLCHPKPLMCEMLRGYLAAPGVTFEEIHSSEKMAGMRVPVNSPRKTVLVSDLQLAERLDSKWQVAKIFLTDSESAAESSSKDPLSRFVRTPVRRSKLISSIAAAHGIIAKSASPKLPEQRPQFSLRVLLAEDNAVNRSVAQRMLDKFGIKIDMAEDGQQAVEACQAKDYDLVLMDVMMPVMDGHEATRIIRQAIAAERQPLIVALTANAFVEDRAACLDAGMDDVVADSSDMVSGRVDEELAISKDAMNAADKEAAIEQAELDPRVDGGLHAWVAVVCSFLIQFLVLGVTYSFGFFAYQYYYVDYRGQVSKSTTTLIGSLMSGVLFLVGPLTGRAAEMFGYKICVAIGTVLVTLSLVLASFATAIWQLFLTQGILFAVGGSLLFFPASSLPAQWWVEKRSFATGLAVSGSGVGGLVMSYLTPWMLGRMSTAWTLRAIAIAAFVIGGVATILMRTRFPPKGRTNEPLINFGMFRDRRFPLLFMSAVLVPFGYLVPFTYLPLYCQYAGFGPETSKMLLALINGMSIVGRIGLGLLADKIGNVNGCAICNFLGGFSMIIFWLFGGRSLAMLVLFACFYGVLGGGYIALTPTVLAQLFGVQSLASLMGLLYAATSVGTIASDPLAGALMSDSPAFDDPSWTMPSRGYWPGILFSGLFMIAGGLCTILLRFVILERRFFVRV
ncbi:hypothetical protein RI367_007939 [Sorochytrium milnesiophthora]